MKKAFTMIELIFVIVILGILAAIAIPKFFGIASEAKEANLKHFISTLNATEGPMWWSKANNGDISTLGIDSKEKLNKYINVPKEISEFNLDNCNDSSKFKIIAIIDKSKLGTNVNYYIACKDGDAKQSPRFILLKPKSVSDDGLKLGDENVSSIDVNNNIKINQKNEIVIQQ